MAEASSSSNLPPADKGWLSARSRKRNRNSKENCCPNKDQSTTEPCKKRSCTEKSTMFCCSDCEKVLIECMQCCRYILSLPSICSGSLTALATAAVNSCAKQGIRGPLLHLNSGRCGILVFLKVIMKKKNEQQEKN